MMSKIYCFLAGLMIIGQVNAQRFKVSGDTLSKEEYLPDVTVVGKNTRQDIHQLPEIVGTHVFAGKKNALVVMDHVNGNVVMNNMRQVMAKVPGIHIWESDGSGIQIGIATRGLSPNRSWDFNVRQNGFDISSDPYGYPEAYYHPPLQAVQRVQIVKGAGSLAFGPQLGGMVNYVMKNGSEINKPFSMETEQTIGGFGMINSYNAIGGETKNFHYYAAFDHRSADGWRQNSGYHTNTGFGSFTWKVNSKLNVNAEYTRYSMLSQQPGGLTDVQFNQNSRQSLRNRNWFNNEFHIGAVTFQYNMRDNNRLELKVFGLSGDRNSVGFMQAITVKDSLNPLTGQYANRTVDIDQYRNFGAELRYLQNYTFLGLKNTFSAGLRYFNGLTRRYRNGKGTAGTDFDMTVDGLYPGDLRFGSINTAISAENIIHVTDKLILIPGIRYERVTADVSGRTNISNGVEVKTAPTTRDRSFVLFGMAAEYHLGKTEFYANYTESYRPIHFADLSVPATTDIVDPNLRDSRGYSMDIGYRGKVKNWLMFDLSVFWLNYADRIGAITQLRPDNSSYNFRTNVGNSISKGVEAFAEINFMQAGLLGKSAGEISLFASYSYTDARYDNVRVVTRNGNNLVESNLRNKYVENAPEHILRSGLNYFYKGLSVTAQISYVSQSFADANNTVTPNATATAGLIPAYLLSDLSFTYHFKQRYSLRGGINNLGNLAYFTRRAGGYPGPGLMPADGRNFFLGVGFKL